ncbi:hypothetical protein Q0M94_22875 (plasmid) [Deinococcus radiomollis]|uniref:hypothetical protein n=1 Tax=Deinococcus radiomollis TaxID=468916 RepID=UPI003892B807
MTSHITQLPTHLHHNAIKAFIARVRKELSQAPSGTIEAAACEHVLERAATWTPADLDRWMAQQPDRYTHLELKQDWDLLTEFVDIGGLLYARVSRTCSARNTNLWNTSTRVTQTHEHATTFTADLSDDDRTIFLARLNAELPSAVRNERPMDITNILFRAGMWTEGHLRTWADTPGHSGARTWRFTVPAIQSLSARQVNLLFAVAEASCGHENFLARVHPDGFSFQSSGAVHAALLTRLNHAVPLLGDELNNPNLRITLSRKAVPVSVIRDGKTLVTLYLADDTVLNAAEGQGGQGTTVTELLTRWSEELNPGVTSPLTFVTGTEVELPSGQKYATYEDLRTAAGL